MAAWRKEAGSCLGRLFDAGGFLGKFKAWVVKTPASGGPGWFIIDDQSSAGADPYIVISDVNYPYANANKHKILVVQLLTGTPTIVQCLAYHYWDVATHSGIASSAYGRFYLRIPDTGSSYDFRGGPSGMEITSRDGSTIDTWLIDEWIGPDDTIVLEPESKTGTLALATHIESGDNNNQLSNYHQITGIAGNIDANGKMYFSIVISGSNITVNIYKDSARTQLVGHAGPTTSAAPFAIGVTADNSSGLGGQFTVTAKIANDVDIDVDFSLTVGAGQGSNFTPGNDYFLFDYSASGVKVAYTRVTAVVGDKLIVNYLGANVFPVGAMISPYPHRWALMGTYNPSFSTSSGWAYLPYYSVSGGEIPTSFNSSGPRAAFVVNGLYTIANPDDRNYYRASELLIYEVANNAFSSGTRNRHYGIMKHVFVGSATAMAVFTDGRTLDNGLNYFYISTVDPANNNGIWLIQDSEFNS